jgi:ethanolamine utilization protein EutM
MIETKGLVPLMEAVDAMCKAASVAFLRWETAGAGLVTAFIEGDVAAVRASVDAGAEAAARLGQVVAAQVIPHPHPDLETFSMARKGGKGAAAKA